MGECRDGETRDPPDTTFIDRVVDEQDPTEFRHRDEGNDARRSAEGLGYAGEPKAASYRGKELPYWRVLFGAVSRHHVEIEGFCHCTGRRPVIGRLPSTQSAPSKNTAAYPNFPATSPETAMPTSDANQLAQMKAVKSVPS